MSTVTVAASEPWYRSLNTTQWKTVFASNLGWMFDGYETFALILVVGVALRDLLEPSQFSQIPAYAGTLIGGTGCHSRYCVSLLESPSARNGRPAPR